MKKIIFTFVIAFSFMFMNNIHAQSYNSAVGAKLGWGFAASYKKAIKESLYVDFYGGFYGVGGFFAGAAAEFHKPLQNADEFYWYYGGGAFVSSYTYGYLNETYTVFGINGVLGIDYAFSEIPLNISADWMPGFGFGSGSGLFAPRGGGLTVRYILGQY